MDAPAAQYTTTSDGVSIAWSESGQGPTLLYIGPFPFTHLQEHYAAFGAWFEAMERSFRVINFDARGIGMSERDVTEVSVATLLKDAEAVLGAAKADHVIVFSDMGIVPASIAVQVAVAHSKRVTHVVLESPFESQRDVADTPYARVGPALAEADWDVFLQTHIRVLGGWDASESAWLEPVARTVAGWMDASVGRQYVRLMQTIDLGELLPRVTQPTLVIRNDPGVIPDRACQRVTAKIPGAQYRRYKDPTYVQAVELTREFVGVSGVVTAGAPAVMTSGTFRTILFTDIVGHTEMMQRLGDAKGRDVLREHERITREMLKQHGGAEVKTMGDGFMASFGSVTSAMECAIALQRAFAAHTVAMPEPLHVRVGLNAGEPIEEDGDLFGATVILASRIAAKAGAGEILIPEPVRHLLSGKTFVFSDRGEYEMKGFDDAVRLYEVRWRPDAAGDE
jgi:class 3 adenylate cyclase